jgi:hypothetical protein
LFAFGFALEKQARPNLSMYRRSKVILAGPANPSEAAVIKMFQVFHGQKEAAKLRDPPLLEKVIKAGLFLSSSFRRGPRCLRSRSQFYRDRHCFPVAIDGDLYRISDLLLIEHSI